MGVSAGIVVTGTEVLTGRVADLNGPWLAEQLLGLGVDVGQIVVVGDRPDDLRSALEYLRAGNDLVITSGGLGPTADDLTAAVVAQVQGCPVHLDPALERRIAAIVARLSARFGGIRDPEATAIATRKQALVPAGASVLEPTGTAPGLVVPAGPGRDGPPVVVLPGPPGELRQMWPAAVASAPVRAILAGAPELRQATLRLWEVPESELAATLRRADGDLTGLEITTCLRAGELEIVSRYRAEAEAAQQRLVAAVRADFRGRLYSECGRSVDELVRAAISDRGWSLAVADSVTAGALTARLAGTRLAGGLVVVRADTAVPDGAEAARALADRARAAFGADVGLGVTGPVGPAGQAAEADQAAEAAHHAPTGTVHLCLVTPLGTHRRELAVTGTADRVAARVGPAALHLLLRALTALADPG